MAAPDGLSDAAQRVFDGVVRDWELDERELATLTRACVQLTIAERLEHAVARDGETVVGSRGQPRVHPAIAEARQCAEAGVRMLARLELRDEVPLPESERARKAAHARWENARRRAASGLEARPPGGATCRLPGPRPRGGVARAAAAAHGR